MIYGAFLSRRTFESLGPPMSATQVKKIRHTVEEALAKFGIHKMKAFSEP